MTIDVFLVFNKASDSGNYINKCLVRMTFDPRLHRADLEQAPTGRVPLQKGAKKGSRD
jgi:hypothetical protein